jgi:hypothetical protein
VHEFITVLRQLRRPLVLIAVAILVLQTLVAGLASAHAAARLTPAGTEPGVLCHGNGDHSDDGSVPGSGAAHDCCIFCTASGPAALVPARVALAQFGMDRHADALSPPRDLTRLPRAIRAGPSQAPPTLS